MAEEAVAEEKSKLLGPDYLPEDEASVRVNADYQENPRLLLNIPASKLFITITESDPPFLIVAVRADNPISAKGALSHAHDLALAWESRNAPEAKLSNGVGDVMRKLAQGVKS